MRKPTVTDWALGRLTRRDTDGIREVGPPDALA